MQIATDYKRRAISFADMKNFLSIGWGELGETVADSWRDLNKKHFKNALEPLPIVIVNTSPYGRWLGCTYCNVRKRRAHLIQLAVPRQKQVLLADRGTLLHEMLHQQLTEAGDSPAHAHAPWCEGIMRLHFDITGKRIYAAPETVTKTKALDPITGKRKSIRVARKHPDTGLPSIDRLSIATWPHSLGVRLGDFITPDDLEDDDSDDA
jgi:hypothetical protein